MSKKVLILTAIVLVFSACELQAAVAHSTWVGGEGGLWSNASNWDPAIVPDNSDWRTFAVSINGGSEGVRVALYQIRTIDRLDCYGTVEIYNPDGGEVILADPNAFTNYGDLEVVGLTITGNVINAGGATLLLYDGPNIKGNLYNLSGATLEGGVEVEEGDIQNAGLIILRSGHDMWADYEFHNTGEIRLMDGLPGCGGIFYNHTTGVITGFGKFSDEDGQVIQNEGKIIASGDSLFIYKGPITNIGILRNDVGATLHIEASTADVNNHGTIEINASGAIVFDCNLVNDTNGVIELLGGTLAATTITQAADANFAGFGGITGDIIIDPNGMIKLTGPTNIVGNMEIGNAATLDISDGTTLITGQTTCNGTIHMKGGRIIPQGGLSGDCNIIWEPGTFSNVADFNLDGWVNFEDFAYFADAWLWQTSWQ